VSQVESKLRWISGEKSEARKKQEQITMDVKAISEYEEDLLKRGSSLTVDELAQGKNRIDERKKEISIRQANLDRESWLLSRYEQDLLGGSYSMPLHEIERTIERIPERRRASKEALHAEFQKRYCESLAMLQEGLGGETSRFNPLIRRLISYNPDARRTCAEAETEFTTLFPPTVDQP
jgi:hypothetical protein